MRCWWRAFLVAGLIALAGAAPAAGETGDEAAAKETLEKWYAALRGRDSSAVGRLLAPNAILKTPLWKCFDERSRMCKLILAGERMAVGAVRFTHEVSSLTVEDELARATVIERGWFLSGHGEYKRTALAVFFLVRDRHGAWLVAANSESGIGNLE